MSRTRSACRTGPEAELIELRDVHQRFGAVAALRGAGLSLRVGEVHALLGENGAGKSTLLRVLAGLQAPDRGELSVRGRVVHLHSPRDAWHEGIGLVHQHFTLVPRLTVLENLALGIRGSSGGWRGGLSLPLEHVARRAREVAVATGLAIRPNEVIERLGVGDRQRVEILKVLLREPRVVALDEPTAVLAPVEIERLFTLLRQLATSGRTVLIVAHKLDEVLSVADRVTVLRAGRTVLEAERASVNARALADAMLGQEAREAYERAPVLDRRSVVGGNHRVRAWPEHTERVASLERVELWPPGQAAAAEDPGVEISLDVHRGEIVGVAGVEGNGQRELALVLSGRRAPVRGRVTLPPDPAFIPQDRSREALAWNFDLAENFALALHRLSPWRHGPVLRWSALRTTSEKLLARYQVLAEGTYALARTLSGGNQQRVVIARELEAGHDLLVAENPTRGLDLAASAFVHGELARLREGGGIGIVLLSTDLAEVLTLADRVFVMVRGRLLEVPTAERTRSGVGELMLSASAAAAEGLGKGAWPGDG